MFAHEGICLFFLLYEKVVSIFSISDNSATSNFGFCIYFAVGFKKTFEMNKNYQNQEMGSAAMQDGVQNVAPIDGTGVANVNPYACPSAFVTFSFIRRE